MANFRNTDAIDFITDPTGQTAKSGVTFLSELANGTLDGALLTPFNTIPQALAAYNSTYIGDGVHTGLTTGGTQALGGTHISDTPRLSLLKFTGAQVRLGRFKGVYIDFVLEDESTTTKKFSNEGNVRESAIRIVSFLQGVLTSSFTRINEECFFSSLRAAPVGGTGHQSNELYCFKSCIFQDGFQSSASGGPSNIYLPTEGEGSTLAGVIAGNPGRGIGQSNFYKTLFKVVLTGDPIPNPDQFFKATRNSLFDADCEIQLDNNGVITTYADLTAAKAANAAYFIGCQIGEMGWLGDPAKGELAIKRDSDIYTKVLGFTNVSTVRPSKASWLINSATTGGIYNNTTWASDRLIATSANGYYQKEIVIQSTGLINPIFWMSRGLDMISHTPSNNVGTVANPAILTFTADYKTTGGAYTGVYKSFQYNRPIGFDANGVASGEDGFNPTTLVPLSIEALNIRIYVKQGANTPGTGIYGGYLAPSIENFCLKIVDQSNAGISGLDIEVTTLSDSRILTTDVDGFTEFAHITGLDEASIEINDIEYFDISKNETRDRNYNFYQYKIRKKYRYRVRTVKDADVSEWSNIVTLTE